MKTLRFQLPVLDPADAPDYLDLVTGVRGVVAALLDAEAAALDVVVASDEGALLVRAHVNDALRLGWAQAVAT